MAPRSARTALTSALRRARALLNPRGALTPVGLALFDERRVIVHSAALRIFCPLLIVVHLASAFVFSRQPARTQLQVEWLRTLTQLHLLSVPFAVAALAAVTASVRRIRESRVRTALFEGYLRYYPLFGALVAANAQRTTGAYGYYVACVMAASLAVVDAGSALAVQAIAATVLISQIIHTQPDAALRNAAAMTVAGIAGLGFVWSRIAELVLVNDVRARLAVDETRQSLEARVNEQMKEIFGNIEEIARLNRQLDAQVQQRSRELSLALARLAEGASGRRTITPGTIVGMRFVVDAPLNTGGSVWLADDRVTNSRVVLRVGQATSAGELDVFNKILGEIDALTTARHPVFVRTIHIDLTNDGFLVQALEYVPGLSLDRWIATHGVLPALVVARIGALLAEGLATAHQKGIVHRAVTTANVLVSTFSPGVRLIGFGAARAVTEQSGGPQTLLSGVSPEFLAPESIGGDAVDGRADVYCLGLVLYAALTARTPYAPTTGAGWLKAHATEAPKPLRELAPNVPVELEAIVMSCLRKDRAERPTASELGEQLLKLANERAAGTVDEFVRGIDADSTDVRRIASG